MFDEKVQEAIRTTIAAEILKGIDSEARNTILQKSIVEALKDYSFKNAIEKVVVDRAIQAAKEMVESDEVGNKIDQAVTKAVDDFTNKLPTAVHAALLEALFGKDNNSSYDRGPGLVLKHMKKE